MIGSSLAMAMGIVLLVPVRMSDSPQALGLLVFAATVLIAAACAMHLTTIIAARRRPAAPLRALLVIGAWLAMFGGAAWAISRAPGGELVVAMMTCPPLVGLAGVLLPPGGSETRWHGVPFLGLAIGLALLVLPAWLTRLGG